MFVVNNFFGVEIIFSNKKLNYFTMLKEYKLRVDRMPDVNTEIKRIALTV